MNSINFIGSYNISTQPYPAFLPSSVSGLSLWLDSSNTNSVTLSGSTVNQWNDLSGNSRNSTPFMSANTKPTFSLNGLNSKPTISFIQGGSGLVSSISAGTFSSGITVFAVCQVTGTGTYTNIFTRTIVTFAAPIDIWNDKRFVSNGSVSGNNYTSSVNLNVSSVPYVYITSVNSSTWSEWFNGTSALNTAISGYSDTASSFYLGIRGDTFVSLTGNISEILVYNSVLSTANRQNIENYLKVKWRINYTGLST